MTPPAARVIVRCRTEKCGWVTPDPSGYCARCRANRAEPKDVPPAWLGEVRRRYSRGTTPPQTEATT